MSSAGGGGALPPLLALAALLGCGGERVETDAHGPRVTLAVLAPPDAAPEASSAGAGACSDAAPAGFTAVLQHGPVAPVTSLAWSSDGALFFTISRPNVYDLEVWDGHTGARRGTLAGWWCELPRTVARGTVRAYRSGKACSLDLKTGEARESVGTEEDGLDGAIVGRSAGGEFVVTVSAHPPTRWSSWDAATRTRRFRVVQTLVRPHDVAAAVTADGARVAFLTGAARVIVRDGATGAARATLLPARSATAALFRPDGARLVLRDDRGDLTSWDAAGGAPPPVPLGNGEAIAFSDDGARLLIGGQEARVVDASTGARIATLAHPADASVVLPYLRPDGRVVAGIVRGGAVAGDVVTLWDASTGSALRAVAPEPENVLSGIAWSPDGARLATVSRATGTLRAFDVASGALAVEAAPRSRDRAFDGPHPSFSPDGSTLAARDHQGLVLYDAATLRVRAPVAEADGDTRGLAWGPRGETLAFGRHREVLVASARDGTIVARFDATQPGSGDEAVPWDLAWSPDGATLAVEDLGGMRLSLFDAASHAMRASVSLDRGSGLVFSPDGRTFAVAPESGGHVVQLAEPDQGQIVGELPIDPRAWVDARTMAFSADGSLLAIASSNTHVNVWDVRAKATIELPVVVRTMLPADASIAWSPRGDVLAIGGRGLHVCRVRERTCVALDLVPRRDGTRGTALAAPGGAYDVTGEGGETSVVVRQGTLVDGPVVQGAPSEALRRHGLLGDFLRGCAL